MPVMTSDSVSAKLWWAVPAAVILVLVTLAALVPPQEPGGRQTSYDASARGFRAAYLLLDELGYPVMRAKRIGGSAVLWVLYPMTAEKDATRLDAWVRGGGALLLAADSPVFAAALDTNLKVEQVGDAPGEEEASGLDVERLATGRTWTDWPGQTGEVIVRAGHRPAVTVYARGRGEIWLLNRPEMFTNALLRRADNAVLLARLATRMLEGRTGKLGFDEYFHGMKERPGVMELLFEPPAVWVTVHSLLLLGLLLWHYAPRFGALTPMAAPTRRSKEEFLDAMAALLERKGDAAAAFASVRDDFARQLERELGLPAGTSADRLVEEAERRRPGNAPRLRRLLTEGVSAHRSGHTAFLHALNELEAARDEFFRG